MECECQFTHNLSLVREERGGGKGSGSSRTQPHTPWINGRQGRNGGCICCHRDGRTVVLDTVTRQERESASE